MAVKRRIIWMSDEEWTSLGQVAKDRGDTISAVIRDFWRVAATQPIEVNVMTPPATQAQANRDAILRRINKGG